MSEQAMKKALDALEEISHAVSEIHRARSNPRWFTGGERAAMQHELLWIGKSAEIVRNKTGPATEELRAAIDAEAEPVAFLADATRFKVRGVEDDEACRIYGIPHELNGRWVALVAADDNCHLKLNTPPDPEGLRRDAERYRILRRGQTWSVVNGIGDTLRAHQLDSSIDAAIAAQGGGI
jgi:hypothetical protein